MKTTKILLIALTLCISCREADKSTEAASETVESSRIEKTNESKEAASETVDPSWVDSANIRPLENKLNFVLKDHLKSELKPLVLTESTIVSQMNSIESYIAKAKLVNPKNNDTWSTVFTEEFLVGFADNDCWNNRPKTIYDLTDGVLIDVYSFEKGDEKKLDILGFFNINLEKNQKVVVIEFLQEGTQFCSNKRYKYGVGARLMLHITKVKNKAKLATPQQITASVIFGFAEVKFSLKTFGIVGPGVANLNSAGSLSEDTYQQFLQEISELIKAMYTGNKQFIITPQPLFLKNTAD